MTDAARLTDLVRQWRDRGNSMCPDVPPPYEGWNAFDSTARAMGAMILHHADQLEAALAAEPAAQGWQPIETAPKEHQAEILALHRGRDGAYMSVVWWDETVEGWLVAALADQSIYVDPTHWMPLPDPPKHEPEGTP